MATENFRAPSERSIKAQMESLVFCSALPGHTGDANAEWQDRLPEQSNPERASAMASRSERTAPALIVVRLAAAFVLLTGWPAGQGPHRAACVG